MALAPVTNCSIRIDPDYITLSIPPIKEDEHPEVIAKADTETVLAEIFGITPPTITTPLGMLPRGLRYISADRTLYAIEYEPGPVGLLLPKRMGETDPSARFVTAHMPKHFISVKFNAEFSQIIGAALSLSYDYNYTVNDPVQMMFGMKSFEFKAVPTPNIGQRYNTIGAFLGTLRERVLGHAFSFLTEDELDWSQGHPTLPDQYTPEIAKEQSFLEFWVSQGEMAYDWTFADPVRSTLADIMYLNTNTTESLDIDSMEYPQIIAAVMELVKKHNKLKMLKAAEKAYNEAMASWKTWRTTDKGKGITIDSHTPLSQTEANDLALISG